MIDEDVFAKIYWLFSREAVASGSLDRFCQNLQKPKGLAKQLRLFRHSSQIVDNGFLKLLEEFRERLAVSFKRQHCDLDGPTLTEITQRTLDRLVFLRFLEDKLIENKIQVSKFGITGSTWADFVAASADLDKKYNGIVFKKHIIIDNIDFLPDDSDFADICDELSDTNSPYDFNAIPIYVLGSIYELFLGKVIITNDKKAWIEEKPDVRRAGGVFYTPTHIVDFVVDAAISGKLAGKSPKQIASLKFADIACGSGSFLLGLYDRILRHVTLWYNENTAIAEKDLCIKVDDGTWRLSLHQKRQILLNNIFGVDIDAQAVEVSQLSLYLKLLENETTSSAYNHQLEFEETILPSLNRNIMCGNSLVEPEGLQRMMFSPDEERRANAFPFRRRFKALFDARKGFDAIVGNPPYIRIQALQENNPVTAEYAKRSYVTGSIGNFDVYALFIERALDLMADGGELGYIVPNKFFTTDYGVTLRSLIASASRLKSLVDFGHSQVFAAATTYTCLLFLSKATCKVFTSARADAAKGAAGLSVLKYEKGNAKSLTDAPWSFASKAKNDLVQKVLAAGNLLSAIGVEMNRGSSSGADDIFMVDAHNTDIEDDLLRTPIFASDFGRFAYSPSGESLVIFPYQKNDLGKMSLIPEEKLKTNYPRAYDHLKSNSKKLVARAHFAKWYAFSAPRSLDGINNAAVLVPLLANKGLMAAVPTSLPRDLCPMASGGFTLSFTDKCPYDERYILGIVNSAISFWMLRHWSNVFRGGWITCTKQYFHNFPIPFLDKENILDKKVHDSVVNLVELCEKAISKLKNARTERDQNYWEAQLEGHEGDLEDIVADLFKLTSIERAIVASIEV